MRKYLFSAMAAGLVLSAASCGNDAKQADANAKFDKADLAGAWVEPIPGIGGEQGVKISEDGKAESINMATLQYEAWSLQGDTLVLQGKSLGNGQTIDFSDTLIVNNLTADSLTVTGTRGNGMTHHYSRLKAE